MKRLLLFTAGLLLCTPAVFAQFEQDYTPLVLSGNIPAAFIPQGRETVQRSTPGKREGNLSRREQQAFLTTTNYALKAALQSGAVLFNDSLSNYVQLVADKALIGAPKLREKVNIYVTRYTVPNASAWRDGTIFINVGLLSKLQSEAQLAFVICHEAAHVQKRHVLRNYQKKKEIEKSNRRKAISFSQVSEATELDQLIHLLRYRKRYEFEADKYGFEIFQASGYRLAAAVDVMDVLAQINLGQRDSTLAAHLTNNGAYPFALAAPLDLDSIFATTGYTLEANLACFERAPASEADDELSTHPSIADRRAVLVGLSAAAGTSTGDVDNYYGAPTFDYFRTLAAFEEVARSVQLMAYSESMFRSLELLARFPQNQYLHEVVATSLYWLAFYDDLNSVDNVVPEVSEVVVSNHARVICLLEHAAKANEFGALAEHYFTYAQEKFPACDLFPFLQLRLQQLQGETPDYQPFFERFPSSVFRNYPTTSSK
ncbi:MAG: M48 family metallopeptidase [Bacteroidota bacterium]